VWKSKLCGGVIPERPSKNKIRPRPEMRSEYSEMMFTGTLIEDLIATVERAEARSQDIAPMEIEPWIVSAQENADYDSNLVWQESGVA
jgi:hypothetical protein